MNNPKNREATVQLYRWMELHEYPPKMTVDESCQYFTDAWLGLEEIIQNCQGSEWIKDLAIGYYQALENRYKETKEDEQTDNNTRAHHS